MLALAAERAQAAQTCLRGHDPSFAGSSPAITSEIVDQQARAAQACLQVPTLRLRDWSKPTARSQPQAGELHLREFLDRVAHALAPDAGILHAAERIEGEAEAARLVDPQRADVEVVGEAERRAQILREH